MQSDFVLLQKCSDMIEYGYTVIRQFPKSERHVLSTEIRQSMLTLQRLIIVCGKKYHKKTTLTIPRTDNDETMQALHSYIQELAELPEQFGTPEAVVWPVLNL